MALEGPQPDHLVKVNDYAELPWWRRVGASKARRDLERAGAIAALGIATPCPVAVGEQRSGPLLTRCYELVPWLADAIDLRRAREEGAGTPAERRARSAALGALVRRMHDAGVDQRDLAPNNFLWRAAADPSLFAIDFERTRVGAPVAPRARIAALAKLDRHCVHAPASERMRFLRAYCEGDRAAARGLWRAVEAASAELMRRDAARWRRTATRRGRRFEPVDLPIGSTRWRGWARRGTSLEALRTAFETGGPALHLRPIEPASRAGTERAWGLALALHQRAAMPEPIAALHGGGCAWLLLERGATRLDGASDRAPLVVLFDRLLGWGAITETLGDEAIAREDAHCVLLDAGALRLDAPHVASGRRAAARRRVDRLLATPTRDGRAGRDGSRP